MAADAAPAERYAAQELQRFVRRATVLELPIVDSPERRTFYVGDSPAFRASRVGFDPATLAEEDHRTRVRRRAIAIAGGSPRGTLYGVYDFCERYLGVRFLTPDHTHVPKLDRLDVPRQDRTYTPPFDYRWSYYYEMNQLPRFMARLRQHVLTHPPQFGGGIPMWLVGHGINQLVPVERFGESNPEYFALVDGERLLTGYNGPQICSTNPDVVDVVTQGVLAQIAKHPQMRNVVVGPNDNLNYCTCDRCATVNAREESLGAAHLTLVNAVAERVAPLHPDVRIGTLAYRYSRKAPKHLTPHPNVEIWVSSFECSHIHAINDPACPENVAFCADLDAWLAYGNPVYIWHYIANLRYVDLPFPNLHTLAPTLRYFRDRGVRGVYMQGNGRAPAGELSDLRNYVTSRLLWDPTLDAEVLIDEFLTLHYGPGADTVRAYIEATRRAAEAHGAYAGLWSLPLEQGLNPVVADELVGLFESTTAKLINPTYRERLEKVSIAAYKAYVEAGGVVTYANHRITMQYPRGGDARIRRYVALCEKYGQTRNQEFQELEEYLGQVAANRGGTAAQKHSIGNWELTLLPEMGELIVDLRHLPSGFPVVSALGRGGINLTDGVLFEGIRRGMREKPTGSSVTHAGNALTFTNTYEDGSVVNRRISFASEEYVEFETSLVYDGADPRTFQFNVEADLNTGDRAEGYATTKLDELWSDFSPTPYQPLSDSVWGVGYRNGTRVGHIVFNPRRFESPRIYRQDGLNAVDVRLRTKPVTLNSGDTYSYRYRIEYTE